MKENIHYFLNSNTRICATVFQMVDHINNNLFKWDDDKQTYNYKIYFCLRNNMNFRWRKASKRHPRWFQNLLEEARKVFKISINKLQEVMLVIELINGSLFSSSAFSLYW